MRFVLNGEGLAIPNEALPDPSESGDLPPQTLLLPPGNFDKTDYVGLGYTHFEVWCIGAAGGRGGSTLAGHYGYDSSSRYYGGAGGGGGLHHVVGLLSDLATLTPVVVGVAGATGVDNPGPAKYLLATSYGLPGEPTPNENLAIVDTGARPLTRGGNTYIRADGSYVSPWTLVDVLGNPIPSTYAQGSWGELPDHTVLVPRYSYIVRPNPSFVPTQDGLNGGYSKFGEFCKASGGKGGKRAPLFSIGINVGLSDERWYQYHRYPEDGGMYSDAHAGDGHPGGFGGDGGIGGTIVAGGGGAGGSHVMNFADIGVTATGHYQGFTPTPPEDGTWDGDIGEGGGGGHGGGYKPAQYNPSSGFLVANEIVALSQNGGQGSFNYGDTSKYGARENRSTDPVVNRTIVPGAGGGAKFNALQMYGGRAAGANPDGAVLIRIVKLT